MNDESNDSIDTLIGDYLERAADRVPVSAPPVARLVEQGQRTVRRRRTAAIVAAAAAVLVVAGTSAVLAHGGGHHGSAPVADALPKPPAGTRWVGIGRTVFAVPTEWTMSPGLYCPPLDGAKHVTIVEPHLLVSCPMIRGVEQVHQPISLSERNGQVSVTGGGAAVERSRTTLPKGWLAVPAALPTDHVGDLTADAEAQALTHAGFRVIRKSGPAGMTEPVTTEPAIGEPARVGSTVVVVEKPPASATISGGLSWVGGLATKPARHPGTIHLVGNGVDVHVSTRPDGTWSYRVPAGTYTVTGSSPGYLAKNGWPDSCAADHQVSTGLGGTVKVEVYCQRR